MTRRFPAPLLGLCAALLPLTTACSTSDDGPPAAPNLLATPERTTDASWVFIGSAEYGSTVTVERDPAFGGDDASRFPDVAGVTADDYTATFRMELPLAAGVQSTFTFTSTDTDGNVSESTSLRIQQDTPFIENLGLAILLPAVTTDVGAIRATVIATGSELDTNLEGLEVELSIEGYNLEIAGATLTLDARGRAQHLITGLTSAGSGEIVARAVGAKPDGEFAENRDAFFVVAGDSAAVEVTLSADGGTPAAALTAPAGSNISLALGATDAAGNAVDRTAFRVHVDGPAPLAALGNSLGTVRVAGVYTVTVIDPESLATGSAELTVVPATGSGVEIEVAPNPLVAGETFTVRGRAHDAFGNTIAPDDLPNSLILSAVLPPPPPGERHGIVDPNPTFEDGWRIASGTALVAGDHVVRGRVGDGTDIPDGTTLLTVVAATPAIVEVGLEPTPLIAGEVLQVSATITDVFLNPVTPHFEVSCDAPGHRVVGHEIRGLTQVPPADAPYHVIVSVPGTTASGEATLTLSPAAPAAIELWTSGQRFEAGDTLFIDAQIVDAHGNPSPALNAPQAALTLDEGAAREPISFEGTVTDGARVQTRAMLPQSGTWTLTMSRPGSTLPDVTQSIVVTPGPAASVELQPSTLAVTAGEALSFTPEVTDAFGNAVDAEVALSTDAPGAVITGLNIAGLTRAGAYDVHGQVRGHAAAQSVRFDVVAADPARVDFSIDQDTVVAGETVHASAQVVDAFGNAVTGAGNPVLEATAPLFPIGDPDAQPQGFTALDSADGATSGQLTIRTAGSVPLSATVAELADITAGALTLEVLAAEPAAVSLTLESEAVMANVPVVAEVEILDLHGNPLSAAWTLASNAPGAFVVGDELRGVVRATGDGEAYAIWVRVDGTELIDEQAFTVSPGALDSISLVLGSETVVAGETVQADAVALDRWGNVTDTALSLVEDIDGVDFVTDGAPGQISGTLTSTAAGTFQVTAQDAADTSTSAALTVVAAAPASVTVTPGVAQLVAGEDLDITLDVQDAFGNSSDAPVTLETDAPSAQFVGTQLRGVTRASDAGGYTLVASVDGSSVVGEASFAVVPAALDNVVLGLSPTEVAAGGNIQVSATAFDAFGNVVDRPADIAFVFMEGTPDEGTVAFTGRTDAGGVATATLTPTSAGAINVTARIDAVEQLQDASVVAGAAAAFGFELEAPPAGGYLAGEAINFTHSLLDAFGNAIEATISVQVDAPNTSAVVNPDGTGTISGLNDAGTYDVRARAVGTGLADDLETIVIGANPGAGFNLVLGGLVVLQRGSLRVFVEDGFGNPIDIADVTLTFDPSITQNGDTLTFGSAGNFEVQAALAADAGVTDSEFVSVQSNLDVIPPTVGLSVVFPAQPTTTVVTNGLVQIEVTASDDQALRSLVYSADFGVEGLCVASGTEVLADTPDSVTHTFSFTLPDCALPLAGIRLVAAAADVAGNLQTSAEDTSLTVFSDFTPVSDGFVVTLDAIDDRLVDPVDLLVDTGRNLKWVTDYTRSVIVFAEADTSQVDLSNTLGTTITFPDQPYGISFLSDLGVIIAQENTNRGLTLITTAGTIETEWLSFADRLPRYVATSEGNPSLVCVTVEQDGGALTDNAVCVRNDAGNPADQFELDFLVDTVGNPKKLNQPTGIAIDDTTVWVANGADGNMARFRLNAARTSVDLSELVTVGIVDKRGLLIAPGTGNILIAAVEGDGRVYSMDPDDPLNPRLLVSGLGSPSGMRFDGSDLLVIDRDNRAVVRISPDTDPETDSTF